MVESKVGFKILFPTDQFYGDGVAPAVVYHLERLTAILHLIHQLLPANGFEGTLKP